MEQQRFKELKRGERGAIISIIAYICLSTIKIYGGFWAHSEALKADGFNNATDIIASLAVLIGLRFSQKPADKDHPYGHWKAETVASMIASFIMVVVGIQVVIDAVSSVFIGELQTPNIFSAWIEIFCALVMYLVYRYNSRLATEINSQAVMAAAKDNLSDALVSIGAVIGIIGSQFHLPWLDPVTAIIVGMIICKTAWEIFSDASHRLTDGFDEEQIESYQETILQTNGVLGVKDIKARNYGNNTVVDAVILVDIYLNIQEAHHISTMVEDELKEKHDVYDVHVHVEPNE